MITSTSNQKVKQIVQWQTKPRERKLDSVYLVEGSKMFLEAPEDKVMEVYISEGALNKLKHEKTDTEGYRELYEKLNRLGYQEVSSEVFNKMSDTKSPQGILTVLQRPEYTLEDIIGGKNPLVVVLENLQDPGNLGTIIRTGEGAGITGVIMTNQTVDIYNPKTIRATMGSIYRVPFVYINNIEETLKLLHERGVKTYAAHLDGEQYYDSFSFDEPTAFLIGNEGNGLNRETADMAMHYIKIPMEGKVESLNAAIATSLLMYEAHRQRYIK